MSRIVDIKKRFEDIQRGFEPEDVYGHYVHDVRWLLAEIERFSAEIKQIEKDHREEIKGCIAEERWNAKEAASEGNAY